VFLSRVLLLSWEGAVVESFQDSAVVGVVHRVSPSDRPCAEMYDPAGISLGITAVERSE